MINNLNDIDIIQQADKLLFPEVIFNKPINKLASPRIMILGGSGNKLNNISLCYESIANSYSNATLVLPKILSTSLDIPDAIYLSSNPTGSILKENLDKLIELSSDCNFLIIGVDLYLGSEAQIVIEKLLHDTLVPCLVTDEVTKLFLLNPEILKKRKNLVLFTNTENLIKLANKLGIAINIQPSRGVYNKTDLIKKILANINCSIICYDSDQIICMDSSDLERAGLINFESGLEKNIGSIIGLVGSFLADPTYKINKFIKKTLTACFVAKEAITQNSSIKEVINDLM